MKKTILLTFTVFTMAMIVACGSSSNNATKMETTENQAETTILTEEADDKIAVVYFSGTGNTKTIAEMIADETDADLFEIIPSQAYSDADLNYNDDNCRANKEQNDDSARPEISNDLSVTEGYDIVYLGHPIWWGTVPRIVQTYFETYDLSNATIYTFCTSGGSSIDRSLSDLRGWYPELDIVYGKRLNDVMENDIRAA